MSARKRPLAGISLARSISKAKRQDEMRGICHTMTAHEARARWGVSMSVIREDAARLGEKFAPVGVIHEASLRRRELLQGRCHTMTSEQAAELCGVSQAIARYDASVLGESFIRLTDETRMERPVCGPQTPLREVPIDRADPDYLGLLWARRAWR